jgi:hypothetical protein
MVLGCDSYPSIHSRHCDLADPVQAAARTVKLVHLSHHDG